MTNSKICFKNSCNNLASYQINYTISQLLPNQLFHLEPYHFYICLNFVKQCIFFYTLAFESSLIDVGKHQQFLIFQPNNQGYKNQYEQNFEIDRGAYFFFHVVYQM